MTNIAKKRINKKITQEAWEYLFDLMKDADSSNELRECIDDLFSETEQVMIEKRLAIVCLLKEGKSYKEVSRMVDVSSATISSVKQGLKKKKGSSEEKPDKPEKAILGKAKSAKKIIFKHKRIFIKK